MLNYSGIDALFASELHPLETSCGKETFELSVNYRTTITVIEYFLLDLIF